MEVEDAELACVDWVASGDCNGNFTTQAFMLGACAYSCAHQEELAARAAMASGGMEEVAARPWVVVAAAGPMMMIEVGADQMGDELSH